MFSSGEHVVQIVGVQFWDNRATFPHDFRGGRWPAVSHGYDWMKT